MIGARVDDMAQKVMSLMSSRNGPISMEEIHEQLTEPIGLIHLGISRLVQEGRINVVTRGFSNYLKLPSLYIMPEDREEHIEFVIA